MRAPSVHRLATIHSQPVVNPKWVPSDEQKLTSRHLLRALLRETSYLPNANARAWVKDHLETRFRAFNPDQTKLPHLDVASRWEQLVSTGRKSLRQLRMANIGDKTGVERVLHHTYGRTGRRRHDLMALLTRGDPPVDHIPLGEPVFNPAIMALLKSQLTTKPPDIARKNPKTLARLKPDYKGKTIWMKPKTEDRLRKEVEAERALLLNMLQVPLPGDEFEFLKGVSLGWEKAGPAPKLRTRLSGIYSTDVWLRRQETAELDDKLRRRNISARFMQRRYAAVFAQCPELTWNEERKIWDVTWGKNILQSNAVQQATSRTGDLTDAA